MDIALFQSNSPGRLVAIEDDHAFIPDPLPPDWEFPAELWPLLAEAKSQVSLLEGLGRTLPNPAILLRPLGDREAIRSSKLEGTYATAKELLLFELDPKESKSEQDPANDQLEVFNYRRALNHGVQSELPISLRLIAEMHEILLRGVRGRDRTPGQFRRLQVAIGKPSRFVPPPAANVMECLNSFETYLHDESAQRFEPLVECFLVHYQFEAIHPFLDGNGRVGRLLLAIMLQQRCGLTKPWLYLSEFFDQNRDEYISTLFRVSTESGWHSWIEFCLRGTVKQATDTIKRCDSLRAIRETFSERVQGAGGHVRLNQIVESIFNSPFIRVKDLPDQLGVTYPTASADVRRLVEVGILQELENTSVKTFYSPEVFAIAYDKLDDE